MAAGGRTWDPQRVLVSVPAPLLVLDPDLLVVEAGDAYLAATIALPTRQSGSPTVTPTDAVRLTGGRPEA
jgi:hypothetical protein